MNKDAIERNIEITHEKLENIDKEINSKAHMKRIRDGFEFIYKHMKQNNKKQAILDIGCRNGTLLNIFLYEGFENLYGLDISEEALKFIDDRVNTIVADAQQVLPYKDNSFDVVMATHVIEHLEKPKNAVAEIYRILKKGGLFFVEIPLEISKNYHSGHFCHFTEQKNVLKLMKNLKILDQYEDYKMTKLNGKTVKKRRWFRVIGRKT